MPAPEAELGATPSDRIRRDRVDADRAEGEGEGPKERKREPELQGLGQGASHHVRHGRRAVGRDAGIDVVGKAPDGLEHRGVGAIDAHHEGLVGHNWRPVQSARKA